MTRMLNSGVSILDIEDLVYDDAGVYSCAVQLNNPNFLLEETATLQIASMYGTCKCKVYFPVIP